MVPEITYMNENNPTKLTKPINENNPTNLTYPINEHNPTNPINKNNSTNNAKKKRTLKKTLGKRNLFQSNANRLNRITYGTPANDPSPNRNKNKPLNALPSGERSFLNRMKSFVTRPFRSSPEATLTKSSTNNSSSFRNITNINNKNLSKTRKRKH